MKLRYVTSMIIGVGMISAASAQEVNISSGGEATGTQGSVSYSIGQAVYTTASGSSGTVTQGIQQPYEIFIAVGIENKFIDLSIQSYPNPTTDVLNLKLEGELPANASYTLINASGSQVKSDVITELHTHIPVSALSAGVYFIQVNSGTTLLKTFKIIKN